MQPIYTTAAFVILLYQFIIRVNQQNGYRTARAVCSFVLDNHRTLHSAVVGQVDVGTDHRTLHWCKI